MTSQNSLNNQTVDNDFVANRQVTSAGTPCFIAANHQDTTNPGSVAECIAQATAASGADAYHLSALASTRSWAHGIDASDSGALKETTFAGGSTSPSSGTLTRKVTTAGEQTMPLQPSFRATVSAPILNVTGGGGGPVYEILFDSETFDQNADYTPGTGRFTAPVTGVYAFHTTVAFEGIGATHLNGTVSINVNAGAQIGAWFGSPFTMQVVATTNCQWTVSGIYKLTAGDFVSAFITVLGGAQVIDVVVGSFFSGALIC